MALRTIMCSNDPVEISFAQALLADAGIEGLVLDQFTSAAEGSIGAIPRRLAVVEDDAGPARRILTDAGFAGLLAR